MAQVYSDAAYNTDGYWLPAEEYLASSVVISPSVNGNLSLRMGLEGSIVILPSLVGNITSTVALMVI